MSENSEQFAFDEEIDRRAVPALKVHPAVLGSNDDAMFAAGVADMDFKAPPAVHEALQKRLAHGVFGYEAVADGLLPSLRQWLASRHGWQVDEEHILTSPNVLNALAMATAAFTEEGDGIIVQPPAFFDFFDIVRDNNRTLISNPLILENGCYRMDFEDLARKASDPRARMIYLCNPHNPVGRVWRKEELQRLGDICAHHCVLVVADEMHGDLVFSGHRYTPFASLGPVYAQNSITCLSPAKSFNIASCCCAFTVISDSDRRQAFEAENSRLTVNKNNAFANAAMEAAYRDGEAWLDAVLAYLERNVELVRERLTGIPAVEMIDPEGTFLLWLDLRKLDFEPDALISFLRREAKWAVTRGQAFGDEGAGFVRLNIACTHAKLDAALDQLKDAIAARG